MAKCKAKDCKNEALGFTPLRDGGSAHIETCDAHHPDHLKGRVEPLAKPANGKSKTS